MCNTPANTIWCTDGQNFTELALKYRGVAKGCGCGEGVLGEGLCPMTSYGYTLSDFVSTEPGIAAMLGLGFFPLVGTWSCTMVITKKAKPNEFWSALHFMSMLFFQISYILWGMASDCIFPTAHSVLTVFFLAFLGIHWIITAILCMAKWGLEAIEAKITLACAYSAIAVISLGAVPRIFLTLNTVIGIGIFPNWNKGLGAYAFWFAEAAGLSVTFGCYPMILLAFCLPKYSAIKPQEFYLWS